MDEHEGRAVVGPDSYRCWTPCHGRRVRLRAAGFEIWMAVVVACPACGAIWTVELVEPPEGPEVTVRWRRISPGREP